MLAALAMQPAQAETLPVSGVTPAESDGAAALNTIRVETFGGTVGADVSIRIADTLRDVFINDQQYFTVFPAGLGDDPDGVLRGSVSSEVLRDTYEESRRECVEKDDAGKCVKRETKKITCRKREIVLSPTIRLVGYNGNLLYSRDESESVEHKTCPDRSTRMPTRESVERELADRIAAKVRAGLAPSQYRSDVRVDENRRGLDRGASGEFKQAVRLTKSDVEGACALWQELGHSSPSHAPIWYNLGLCEEMRGQAGEAETLYRKALSLDPRNSRAAEGLRRIEEGFRADHQLAAHYGA
ncbi:MAG: tetratricopeptide repeat protein [Sphingomonadaceae bacterium]